MRIVLNSHFFFLLSKISHIESTNWKYEYWNSAKNDQRENPTVILIAPEFLGGVSIYLSLRIAYSECEITAHNCRTSNSQFPRRSFTGTFLPADPLSLRWTRTLSREKSRFRIMLVPAVSLVPLSLPASNIKRERERHVSR